MNNRIFRRDHVLVLFLVLLAFPCLRANAANPQISGTYEVMGKSNSGPQTKVVLRLHLTNAGPNLLYVQSVLLWDFGHAPSGGPGRPAIALPSGAQKEMTQQFVVPSTQFEQWQKGVRPRVVLNLQTAKGSKVTQAIRLTRVPANMANFHGRKGE